MFIEYNKKADKNMIINLCVNNIEYILLKHINY